MRAVELERILERVELRQRFVGAGLGFVALVHLSQGYAGWLRYFLLASGLRAAIACGTAWAAMDKLEQQRVRFSNERETKYDVLDTFKGDEGKFHPDE